MAGCLGRNDVTGQRTTARRAPVRAPGQGPPLTTRPHSRDARAKPVTRAGKPLDRPVLRETQRVVRSASPTDTPAGSKSPWRTSVSMSAAFGHTIVPSSSSTRTPRKSPDSRGAARRPAPTAGLEINLALATVLEGQSEYEVVKRLDGAKSSSSRAHGNGSIVPSGSRSRARPRFELVPMERCPSADERERTQATRQKAARASRSLSAPGTRRRPRGPAVGSGRGSTS